VSGPYESHALIFKISNISSVLQHPTINQESSLNTLSRIVHIDFRAYMRSLRIRSVRRVMPKLINSNKKAEKHGQNCERNHLQRFSSGRKFYWSS